MNYYIDKNINTPAYIQLYEQLKKDIVNNIYPYGTKLISKRILAEKVGVSIITIEHSYNLLCEEGYIEAKERSGYYIIFNRDDGFITSSKLPLAHQPFIENNATPYKFPFSVLTKTMRKVINDYQDAILEKSPNFGCLELRNAIRLYLKRNRGISIDINQIIIGSGAEYLYHLIIELLGQDKIYAIENPSYEKIRQVYETSNIKIDYLPFELDGIKSSALKKTNATILHISPYRSFPTGITASASKRYEYINWAKTQHRYIIEDDFESEFSISKKAEETIFATSSNDNVIYLNTFSKTISPALRIGYMVLPKHLVPKFINKLGFYSCTVPTFEQFVLAELITNGDFERHINRVRRTKRKQLISNQ